MGGRLFGEGRREEQLQLEVAVGRLAARGVFWRWKSVDTGVRHERATSETELRRYDMCYLCHGARHKAVDAWGKKRVYVTSEPLFLAVCLSERQTPTDRTVALVVMPRCFVSAQLGNLSSGGGAGCDASIHRVFEVKMPFLFVVREVF